MSLIVRHNDRTDPMPAVQRAVQAIDSRVPVYDGKNVVQLVSDNFAQPRLRTFLLSAFAGLAVFLAAIGLYGVLSQAVAHLRRDIGIRMALGAKPNDVLRMVIRLGVHLTLTGVAIGIASSLYFTRFLRTMLYEVQPMDISTMAATAALVVTVTLIAIYIPASRATKVDPIIVLRQE